MSGRLLNVSLQQPTAASSEPAPDSESPPSAPREARRPLKPPAAGLVRSFAWGSMLVGPCCLSPRAGPPSPPAGEGAQMPVAEGRIYRVFWGGKWQPVNAESGFWFLTVGRLYIPQPGPAARAAAWTTHRTALTSPGPTGRWLRQAADVSQEVERLTHQNKSFPKFPQPWTAV